MDSRIRSSCLIPHSWLIAHGWCLSHHPKYSLSIQRAAHSPKPLATIESTTAVVIPTNSPSHHPIHPAMVMSRKLRIPFIAQNPITFIVFVLPLFHRGSPMVMTI